MNAFFSVHLWIKILILCRSCLFYPDDIKFLELFHQNFKGKMKHFVSRTTLRTREIRCVLNLRKSSLLFEVSSAGGFLGKCTDPWIVLVVDARWVGGTLESGPHVVFWNLDPTLENPLSLVQVCGPSDMGNWRTLCLYLCSALALCPQTRFVIWLDARSGHKTQTWFIYFSSLGRVAESRAALCVSLCPCHSRRSLVFSLLSRTKQTIDPARNPNAYPVMSRCWRLRNYFAEKHDFEEVIFCFIERAPLPHPSLVEFSCFRLKNSKWRWNSVHQLSFCSRQERNNEKWSDQSSTNWLLAALKCSSSLKPRSRFFKYSNLISKENGPWEITGKKAKAVASAVGIDRLQFDFVAIPF